MKAVAPDWVKSYAAASDIEKDLHDFTYKGPGLYLTDTDTLIVLPFDDDYTTAASGPYMVYCYNCRFEYTLFFLHN